MSLFKFVFVIVFAIISTSGFGQCKDESEESGMMNIVEPEFIGTNKNAGIKEFIEKNIRDFLYTGNWGIGGTVIIRYNVLPTQMLSDFQVIHGVSSRFNKAVIDVLKSSNGMWKPGTINGQTVPMEREITVRFMEEGYNMHLSAQLITNKADQLLKKGKYSRAIKLYSRAINSFPTYDYTIYQRGIAKYDSGDLEGALNDFKRVADLESHLADPMLARLCSM